MQAMSAENVEVVRRLTEAWERGDLEAQLAEIDPDVEIVEWPEGPDPRTYHGHAGVVEAGRSWAEPWEWLRNEVSEYVDVGDRVLTCGRIRVKGKGSAVEVGGDAFSLHTVRGGKVTRIEFFTDRERALKAAGLAGAESEADVR